MDTKEPGKRTGSRSSKKDRVMWIANLFRLAATWRRYRAGVRELSQLDDRMLHDIGLNRTQIQSAAWNGARS